MPLSNSAGPTARPDPAGRPVVVGVATSVSASRGYDALDTLAYARDHRFPLVQVYLDPRTTTDAARRAEIRSRAAEYGIGLLCHAPGLLGDDCEGPGVFAAARDLLEGSDRKRVVIHYDETRPTRAGVTAIERFHAAGLEPCVENFHTVDGAAAARHNCRGYVDLFRQAQAAGRPARAVLDIPRFFNARLGLELREASQLAAAAIHDLGELNVPTLLHLIDSTNRNMADRSDWCPVGGGVIPYQGLLPMVGTAGQLEAVVLEFEDRLHPVASRPLLEQLLVRTW